MPKRSLIFLLFWPLGWATVSGQESGGLADPMRPYSDGAAVEQAAPVFRLTGVLISPSGRVAIVNGELVEEGARVDGAEVVSIDTGRVRMRRASREFTVSLGADEVRDHPDRRTVDTPVPRARPQWSPETESTAGPMPYAAPTPGHPDSRYGPVRRGETLSSIARRHLTDGVTMDQMMIALFRANPRAFNGNINVLYEGAVLRIPMGEVRLFEAPAAAAAEVRRQRLEWPRSARQRARVASVPAAHGPVQRGETLSGIAQRYLSDGVTMDQMMIALFRANPNAFSGNINVLHEGAVLRIPGGHALRDQTPETATAEVARQTAAWHEGSRRQARVSIPAGGSMESRIDDLIGRSFLPQRVPGRSVANVTHSSLEIPGAGPTPLSRAWDRPSFVEDVPADGGHGLLGLRP